MEFFKCQVKMLVIFILIINTANFCQGKALLEEAESNRGKRSYSHLPKSGLHQTYDSQSNAEHWMKGKFYQPQVDGQPIYVPAVDQPGSYNEFLDSYYKAYTPEWNLATPAPYTYDTKNEKIVTKSMFNKDSFKYTLPTSKKNEFSVDTSPSDTDLQEYDDYDGSEDVDAKLVTSKGKSEALDEMEVLTGSLKKPQLPKTEPSDSLYNQPVVVKTVKQKSKENNEKDVYKNTDKSVIKGVSYKDGVKYESPISEEREFSVEMSNSDDYDLDSEDYDGPDIVDKIIATEINKNSDMSEVEESVIRESLKKSEFAKTKPKDPNQYDTPVVVKTVKQKPKINNAKKDLRKTPSTPKIVYKSTENTAKGPHKKDGVKYESPASKQKEFSVEMNTSDYDLESEDYDSPAIVDKIIATKFSNQKSMTSELEDEKFEAPVVRESLKKSELTKPKDRNQYDIPVVVKTVKQKIKTNNSKQIAHKKPSTPKSAYKNAEKTVIKGVSDKNGVKYESPLSKESEFLVEINTSDDYDLEYEDYDDPEIIDKTNEFNGEKSDMTSKLEGEEFNEPVVSESLKSELTETKPKDRNQYMPVVVKTVKQKPKTNNAKKDFHKTTSAPKNAYKRTEKNTAKGSDKQDGIKYEYPPSKQSEFSAEMSTLDYDLESEDYDDPEVIDETITEFSNEKFDMTSELTDDMQELVLGESVKSELSKTKSKGDNRYMPVVKTKQKSKTNNEKKTQKKLTAQKTIPQLESGCEQQTQTVKAKPNKHIKTASIQKYGDQIIKGTLKKSKGKRKKQYSKPNSRTGESVDKEILDLNPINEESDKLSNTQIKTHKNKAIKTKPVKTKEKVISKQDSQYESATKVNLIVKSYSEDKPAMTDKSSKPVATKKKVAVKIDPLYQPMKNKEKVTVESDSEDKPVKESIQYTSELQREDLLTRKLNTPDEELPESDINISNTDNPLENESDLGSLDMSGNESSAKLNSESTTIKNDLNLETSNSDVLMKPESTVPNANDFRSLASLNSNIWSMLFNPNAEQNKLKLKRCITRNNETGFCTYIQNCEVPNIATSLEQLLNNACVIDDIFIGVCCPEFPVQTIKVHWDQTTSDFDNPIEDEFGHIAEDCGIRSNEALELQSWPWKAPLVSMSNGKIFCGGVVVSEDHILTAAHCTTKIPKNQILVRLGQYDDESGDDYAVVEIKRHAQYNPRTMQNDIALLKLGRRIMNDAHIGIVCLPDENLENENLQNNHNGEIATLLGWHGIFGTKSRDPEFLRVISNKECENKLGMKVHSTSLCTETRKESERTCNADSGTPLVIEDNDRYEVIGILSWNRNDCDPRFPSTFSRVSSYVGWIKNHIG